MPGKDVILVESLSFYLGERNLRRNFRPRSGTQYNTSPLLAKHIYWRWSTKGGFYTADFRGCKITDYTFESYLLKTENSMNIAVGEANVSVLCGCYAT